MTFLSTENLVEFFWSFGWEREEIRRNHPNMYRQYSSHNGNIIVIFQAAYS